MRAYLAARVSGVYAHWLRSSMCTAFAPPAASPCAALRCTATSSTSATNSTHAPHHRPRILQANDVSLTILHLGGGGDVNAVQCTCTCTHFTATTNEAERLALFKEECVVLAAIDRVSSDSWTARVGVYGIWAA